MRELLAIADAGRAFTCWNRGNHSFIPMSHRLTRATRDVTPIAKAIKTRHQIVRINCARVASSNRNRKLGKRQLN